MIPQRFRKYVLFAGAALLGGGAIIATHLASPRTEAAPSFVAEMGPNPLAQRPSAVIAANPEGDVTVIEYFDYQCPVCRRVHPVVAALAATDPKVRIIHKHWPTFGPPSLLASRLALAARWQGLYPQVHDALMKIPGRLGEDNIRAAAQAAGLDLTRAEKDLSDRKAEMDEALNQTAAQAAMLQLRGTPSFVIGDYIVPGGMDLDMMRRVVADVRSKGTGDTP
ncbi:DsbA family protein [Niveispirillum irakense]|uniref:DsbA family protein n=1 Tax=Niveispirillum irakense TaxID=34011 RepID=UPI0003FEDD2A|nr:DsbA family protein [Niveispirillum irakense]